MYDGYRITHTPVPYYHQTSYSVTTDPPLLTGASHENANYVEVAVTISNPVGGSGAVVLVKGQDSLLKPLEPKALIALNLNPY